LLKKSRLPHWRERRQPAGRESTPKELRYRWIYSSVSHLSNVKILLIEDKAVIKEEYDSDFYWEKGAADIKAAVGKLIEAVFCGSDYLGTERFERLYGAESDVVYFDRKEVPISSTELRNGIFRHWAYIPPACRPYYVNRFDLILFLEPTVDFIQDGTRNETIAADRVKYSRQIKELFDSRGLEYEALDGDYLYRFDRAKQLISERFGIETV